MNGTAITFGLMAMVGWGIWVVLANVATRTLDPEIAMIFSYATSVVVALGYVAWRPGGITVERTGVAYALAAGVFAGGGAVAFYAGLERGQTGIVATVSALYFVVAALLGILFLGESLELQDVLGIIFAVLAVALLAR
jgi:uncharacterized membrane protein